MWAFKPAARTCLVTRTSPWLAAAGAACARLAIEGKHPTLAAGNICPASTFRSRARARVTLPANLPMLPVLLLGRCQLCRVNLRLLLWSLRVPWIRGRHGLFPVGVLQPAGFFGIPRRNRCILCACLPLQPRHSLVHEAPLRTGTCFLKWKTRRRVQIRLLELPWSASG